VRRARHFLAALFCAALFLAPARAENPAPAAAASYAQTTSAAITQLITASDLFRAGRPGDGQAVLRSMSSSLDELTDLTQRFRDLASREHDRCIQNVADLERKTSDLFQQQDITGKQLADLNARIAADEARARVANDEMRALSAKMESAAAALREHERKLEELKQWWWVPGYGTYLGIRTLVDQDIENYKALANSLNDTDRRLRETQFALHTANDARRQLKMARENAQATMRDLQTLHDTAQAQLGALKRSVVVLNDAYVFWKKAENLLTITVADQLRSLEEIDHLLKGAGNTPDFDDPRHQYSADFRETLVQFAESVDSGSNFLAGNGAYCGGPP
jgi:hypothetical protein